MLMKRSLFTQFLAGVLIAISIMSCGEPPKKKIIIGNEQWAVNRALTFLAKGLLEQKGYEVEVANQDIEQIFRNLGHGHIDLYMDAWIKGHDIYLFEYQDLVDVGKVYHGCRFGLAVPSYFDIDTIHQLKADSTIYNNTVYGVKKDAGVMIASIEALKAHGMHPQILNMQEDDFVEKIEMLIDKKENFVTAAWKPHWKINYYDLKFLEDTSSSFGEVDEIHIVGRVGFDTDFPDAHSTLSKVYLNDDLLSSYLLMMKDAKDDSTRSLVANEFIEQNPDLVKTWLN